MSKFLPLKAAAVSKIPAPKALKASKNALIKTKLNPLKMDITQFTGAKNSEHLKTEGRLKVAAAKSGKIKILKIAVKKAAKAKKPVGAPKW